MKLRLLTGCAAEGEDPQNPGCVVDVPDDVAKRLLETGQAEPVVEKRPDQRETRAT
jgi:hypothetical protein